MNDLLTCEQDDNGCCSTEIPYGTCGTRSLWLPGLITTVRVEHGFEKQPAVAERRIHA